ncbi:MULTISPECIES: sulfotransferase domain-containing protein [unclassified Salipiger]|uniref:sulfotransferase domain-containing protein n=1 Tax=Salipiger sp. PrR002 TaxID=2706489 RepID=UPI0013B6B9FE|nr:sulfotransferase domain-containing protein [Salipiger sp. PrR002]NDW58867.1 sulfotransferase domain-containing protein [Salipiger sp. PrR004]
MTKISFLIAGVQKGGTTALWHFLSQSSDLAFGRQKELHFFDDESVDWVKPDYDRLHESFAPDHTGCIKGDATPIYTYWPPSLERIQNYNPDMKLIVSLRDPVQRAFSHWRMETSRGSETLPFSEAIRVGRERMNRSGGMLGAHRVYSYVERGFFAAQLDRMFALFPRSQVLLLRQADLLQNQARVLDDVADFLEVRRFSAAIKQEEIFSHADQPLQPIAAKDAAYLRQLYLPDLAKLKDEYGVVL